eukprot:940562-Rhodomonas_salina.3
MVAKFAICGILSVLSYHTTPSRAASACPGPCPRGRRHAVLVLLLILWLRAYLRLSGWVKTGKEEILQRRKCLSTHIAPPQTLIQSISEITLAQDPQILNATSDPLLLRFCVVLTLYPICDAEECPVSRISSALANALPTLATVSDSSSSSRPPVTGAQTFEEPRQVGPHAPSAPLRIGPLGLDDERAILRGRARLRERVRRTQPVHLQARHPALVQHPCLVSLAGRLRDPANVHAKLGSRLGLRIARDNKRGRAVHAWPRSAHERHRALVYPCARRRGLSTSDDRAWRRIDGKHRGRRAQQPVGASRRGGRSV